MFCDEATGQYYLFPPVIDFPKSNHIWQKFTPYHLHHPNIYAIFKVKTLEALKSNSLYGAQAILEEIRWKHRKRFSNDFVACYTRLFIEEFPQFAGCFNLKPQVP